MNKRIFSRSLKPPKGSFFLFGPRGSGKSTWLHKSVAAKRVISLLAEDIYQGYLADSSLFYKELRGLPQGSWVAVDEVQRLPNLLNEVHRLIEEKSLKFALTGSSARKLRRSGVNLLAGRAVKRTMYPLTPMEMGEHFDLERALRYGTLPLVVNAEDPKDTLVSYTQMYLKEEIQAEAVVKNLSGFVRFLSVAALFHGQQLNFSSVARDAEVKRPTAQSYFEILEDTLLARRLEGFQSHLRVREKITPKFYWIDSGIVRALRKNFSPPSSDEKGSLFEGLVFMLLSFQMDTFGEIDGLNYWSPAEAKITEVDFLIQKNREFIAIEVKASSKLHPDHLKGLKAIRDLKGLSRRLLVYLGERDMVLEDGTEVLSFSSFIELLNGREI